MKKPRIIIADTDTSYIGPIEMKFMEELGDNIDLEIITDAEYFSSTFQKPRDADIMIVSEDLYTEDIKRHNIANLFVLSETLQDTQADRPIRIYKYSSLKEIYSRIMSYSSQSIHMENTSPRATTVIVVYSAAGGVGKTTLALGMGMCLAGNFKKVLYVGAERFGNFRHFLTESEALPAGIVHELTLYPDRVYTRLRPYICSEHFDYLPPFDSAISMLGIDYSFFETFVREARNEKEYDLIIVDADSVFDDTKARILSEADKVIIVSGQDKASASATEQLVRVMNCRDNEKYYFICNKYDGSKENFLEQASERAGFVIDEYVACNENFQDLKPEKIGRATDIQKMALQFM